MVNPGPLFLPIIIFVIIGFFVLGFILYEMINDIIYTNTNSYDPTRNKMERGCRRAIITCCATAALIHLIITVIMFAHIWKLT